jgi:hypothetical protein
MYLFPRDCPRILIWPTDDTTCRDRRAWFGDGSCRMIAYIEQKWFEALKQTRLYRYELPTGGFQSLEDAGMWVSRLGVEPIQMEVIDNLPVALGDCGVQLRVTPSLASLRNVWNTSLHVSGIRLRNAASWPS